MRALIIGILIAAAILAWEARGQIDANNNQQSDVWELVFATRDLEPGADADGDGQSNQAEAEAGSNPFDPSSRFQIDSANMGEGEMLGIDWQGNAGKVYGLEYCPVLGNDPWTVIDTFTGAGDAQQALIDLSLNPGFFRLTVQDVDSDSDGVSDWEELALDFDPNSAYTDRYNDTDAERIAEALAAENTVWLDSADATINEAWPDPAKIAVFRSGGVNELTVELTVSGNATPGSDYVLPATTISFAPGQNIAWVLIYPSEDAEIESEETIIVTLLPSSDFSTGSPSSVTVALEDAPAAGLPTANEAARFLMQSTMGPTQELIAEVQSMGIEAWLANEFTKASSYHQPVLESFDWDQMDGPWTYHKMLGWWERAMHAPDQLRQRIAFALSEILVISDYDGDLANNAFTMHNYYDMLLDHSFGNYRDLLEDVTFHPAMGQYLSHMGNRPADPAANLFPDENYSREIMQLFSIGLWMLNNDGTLMLDDNGAPIPTYDNEDITNLAAVFTGMSWGVGDTSNYWRFFWPNSPLERYLWDLQPMAIWDEQYWIWVDGELVSVYLHDQGAKTVLGVELPANDPENPEPNYAYNDVGRALDAIFNHPNVGPFIGRLLIQRLVTSNPSNGYVSRVADAFNGDGPHNSGGVRGDMQSVLRAIYLDPEARDPAMIDDPEHGMLREPYLRLVALARAFDASSVNGVYPIYWVDDAYGMQPLASPSVFNFFSPDYQPLGELRDAGLVAPEFQILTAVTGITAPNHMLQVSKNRLNWDSDDDNVVRLDLAEELVMASDPDALIAHLDLLLTGGSMSRGLEQLIREMMLHPDWSRANDQFMVESIIYLIASSADSAILR